MMARKKRVFVSVICLAVLGSGALWLYATLSPEQSAFPWSQSMSRDRVVFHISGHRLSVPKAYFKNGSSRLGGVTTAVNLEAQLPTMAPYSEEDTQQLKQPGYDRRVLLLIHERQGHLKVPEAYIAMKRSNKFEESGHPQEAFGLQRMADPWPKGREMFVRSRDGHVDYFAMCSKPGTDVLPRCTTYLDYSDAVYVQYSFSRDYLADWQVIHERMRDLVHSFEKAAHS